MSRVANFHPDKQPNGAKRSSKWGSFRKAFLKKNPTCCVCGGSKKLEAHHIKPFHLHPELELDESNLISLCEGNGSVNCHLFVGHLGNFKGLNADVKADAAEWFKKLQKNKEDIKAQVSKSS
jgi:hypothetical protein